MHKNNLLYVYNTRKNFLKTEMKTRKFYTHKIKERTHSLIHSYNKYRYKQIQTDKTHTHTHTSGTKNGHEETKKEDIINYDDESIAFFILRYIYIQTHEK